MLNDLMLWPEKLKSGQELAHQYINGFQSQLPKTIKKIAFAGMGGSGIAGRIIKTFLDKTPSITTFILDSPELPASIDHDTLVLAISYSGNTWETIDLLKQLVKKNIPTLVITHGGKALEIAQAHALPHVIMPESLTPRSALGYFLGFMLTLLIDRTILTKKTLVDDYIKHAKKQLLVYGQASHFSEFIDLARGYDFFHIWGVSGDSFSSAYRAQTQFNENSKVHAVASSFPELCHNLVVGFTSTEKSPFVLFLHSDYLSDHVKMAIQATQELLIEQDVKLYKPAVLGDNFEIQVFDIILWSDFASCYLAKARNIETLPVRLIDMLKAKHKQKGVNV